MKLTPKRASCFIFKSSFFWYVFYSNFSIYTIRKWNIQHDAYTSGQFTILQFPHFSLTPGVNCVPWGHVSDLEVISVTLRSLYECDSKVRSVSKVTSSVTMSEKDIAVWFSFPCPVGGQNASFCWSMDTTRARHRLIYPIWRQIMSN